MLKAEFAKAGITNVVIKDHDNTQTLIARWPAARPSGKKPILLMAHMDVVEAKASDWQNPPFEFREKDGHYLGRGTADNKGAADRHRPRAAGTEAPGISSRRATSSSCSPATRKPRCTARAARRPNGGR